MAREGHGDADEQADMYRAVAEVAARFLYDDGEEWTEEDYVGIGVVIAQAVEQTLTMLEEEDWGDRGPDNDTRTGQRTTRKTHPIPICFYAIDLKRPVLG